jgi:hypothetical protein
MREEPPRVFTHRPVIGTVEVGFDPLRLCIYTTIGILSFILTPAVVVAGFGTIGVVAYIRARRAGLAKSRCKLGDTRLVIAYLAIAALVAYGFIGVRLADFVS